MSTGDTPAQAHELTRRADDSETFDHAVRVGLVGYGIVHLLVAWLAAQLALGDRAGAASGEGALAELAQKPFGTVALWVVGTGFFFLVLWQLTEALWGRRDQRGLTRVLKRLASVGKAAIYGALGVSALKVAIGSGDERDDTDTLTSRLMGLPFGVLLVALVGVAVLAVAGAHVYKGVAENFREHLKIQGTIGLGGRLYVGLGKAGYVAKGVALGLVGALFLYAAWTHDPARSGGLDQALKAVLEEPFGAPLLLMIAVGLGCFGLYCFAWARHLDR